MLATVRMPRKLGVGGTYIDRDITTAVKSGTVYITSYSWTSMKAYSHVLYRPAEGVRHCTILDGLFAKPKVCQLHVT